MANALTRSLGIGKCYLALALLGLDPRGLDDRPPLVDLGPMERSQPLRRLLLARRDVEAEVEEALLRRGIGERGYDRRVDLRDRVLRRPARREEAEPAGHVP